MPLAGFPPKVVSPIEIQILPPKPTQETPRDHWHHTCANLGQNFQITKTAITLRLLVAVTWNLAKSCSHQACTILQNFSSLPPAVPKLSPKRYIFNSFQDPCQDSFQDPGLDSFQDPKYLQNTALLIHIHEISFQDPTRCHCNHHFCPKRKFRSFQDPQFSLFPGSWQVDSSFSSPQSLTGMQRTSNWHLMSGRVRSP